MQQVNGVPVLSSDPSLLYAGLDEEPTWFSAQGGVYKCIEKATNKQVAIKKYLVEENSQYEDMFVMPKELVENEIYSMTKCVHPNILKLLAVHLHQEFVYLIMPLCTGGSLQQYVFEHHLTVGQLVRIITSIASGLAKVHGHGYIHRDIKCDNIFLDQENNNIVIGDFGVVSISPAADSSIEEAGVVLFWSPELVQQKIVNHKVDIWALGIVILEVLNGGKAPYEDEKLDEEEIKQRILNVGRPEYPPNLPSRLVDLLDRCLDPDPRTRSSANNILQHPFLKDYEPELLFPATRLDGQVEINEEEEEEVSVQDEIMSSEEEDEEEEEEELQDEIMHDVEPSISIMTNHKEDTIMLDHDDTSFPIVTTTITTTTASNDKQPAKCRLPLPSFSVDKRKSASIPVNEKIANVIRKRQSMSDTNRSQGSRIPMLCNLQSLPEEPERRGGLRSVKSVKLNTSPTPPQQQRSLSGDSSTTSSPITRKPLKRSNTMYSNIDQTIKQQRERHQLNKSPLSNTTSTTQKRSPFTDIKTNIRKPKVITTTSQKEVISSTTQPKKKKELPPKSSIYRHKRLPAGESRTARLMMGVSTNGRRQSFRSREQQENEKELSPTLGHRFGKLFHKSKQVPTMLTTIQQQQQIPTATTTTPYNNINNKRRPMSFAASSSSFIIQHKTTIDTIPTNNNINTAKSKRQSVPVPPPKILSLSDETTKKKAVASNRRDNNNSSNSSGNGSSSNIKVPSLRVH